MRGSEALAAETGIPAAFVATAVGGSIVAILGRSAVPSGGVSSATAVIFAGAVALLLADPQVDARRASDLAAVVSCASACVLVAGLLQLAFAVVRMGELVKFVPHPVIGGFMNSMAILILLAQIPYLLGSTPQSWLNGEALAQIQPATVIAGLTTAGCIWLGAWRVPRVPAALTGLAAGTLLYFAMDAVAPEVRLGGLTGEIPARVAPQGVLGTLLGPASELLRRHVGELALTALLIALIGSLDTVLNATATDHDVRGRHDPNRESAAFGAANVVCGLLGGLPVVYMRARAIATLRAGGASRQSALAAFIASGILFVAGAPLIALLPLTVLAGVMVTVAVVNRGGREATALRHGARAFECTCPLAGMLAVPWAWRLTKRKGFALG